MQQMKSEVRFSHNFDPVGYCISSSLGPVSSTSSRSCGWPGIGSVETVAGTLELMGFSVDISLAATSLLDVQVCHLSRSKTTSKALIVRPK